MAKLIILSIVILSFVFSVRRSASTRPRQDLRRVQWAIFWCSIVWAYMCLHWYPQIVPLK